MQDNTEYKVKLFKCNSITSKLTHLDYMTTDCAHYEDENDDSELSIQAGPLKHVLHKSLCESPVLYDFL